MKEDLSTGEVFDLLQEAWEAGMRGYYLFGGEPLVRKGVGALVDRAREIGFVTTRNTNGSLLAAKAPQLTGLDFAFVSLDYFDRYHDIIRGRPGSYDEVVRGVERLRALAGTKVTLVTTISTLNLGAMEPMARLAERLGVTISYNSVEPTLDFGLTESSASPNLRLGLSEKQLQGFYETLLGLKRDGYPLLETETVLRDFVEGRPWKCEFPKMFVYVSPDKKTYSCDYRYGYDLRTGSFEGYFTSPTWKQHVVEAEGCNRCVRTCVRGYSYAYEFRLGNLLELAGDARTLFRAHAPRPRVGPPRPVLRQTVPDPPAAPRGGPGGGRRRTGAARGRVSTDGKGRVGPFIQASARLLPRLAAHEGTFPAET